MSCLWCNGDGCKWCERVEIPEWFIPSGQAKRQTTHVQAGRHPMGGRLMPDPGDRRCGNCRFHFLRTWSRSYHKCSLTDYTGGPATDIRMKWPACVEWKPEEASCSD